MSTGRVAGAATLLPGDFELMSWPCYGDDFVLRVAKAMKAGHVLVYEGEDVGGCAANDAFFCYWRPSATERCSLRGRTRSTTSRQVTFFGIQGSWYV